MLRVCHHGTVGPDSSNFDCARCKAERIARRAPARAGYDSTAFRTMRKRVRSEQRGLCADCGQPKPLQVHHRDGNTQNNARTNLVGLCSTCHRAADVARRRAA